MCRGDRRCRHFPPAKQDPCHKRRQCGTGLLYSTQKCQFCNTQGRLALLHPKTPPLQTGWGRATLQHPKVSTRVLQPPLLPLLVEFCPSLLPTSWGNRGMVCCPCSREGSRQAAPSASKWGEDSVKPHPWAVQGESLPATGQAWCVPTGLGIGMGWEM